MTSHAKGASAPLVFQHTSFQVVDHAGKPWLRDLQIGDALGYSQPHLLNRIYQKHAGEFTDSMTAVVKLPTAGGIQEVRIFSLRGAHLLGMFARTAAAAEFRRWVLDILDRETAALTIPAAPSMTLRRWLISFDHLGREHATPIGMDESIVKWDELPALIRDPGFMIEGQLLAEIVHACADRMSKKIAGGARQKSV